LSESWNQSRQVTRLPVQFGKYSCAITLSTLKVVVVGGGVRAREDEPRVEDVEALVLHGPGVEVGDRDDHEALQVELEAEDVLVPLHRLLERGHGELRTGRACPARQDLEQHFLARARREMVLEELSFAATIAKR
jgi:hypothetical protein